MSCYVADRIATDPGVEAMKSRPPSFKGTTGRDSAYEACTNHEYALNNLATARMNCRKSQKNLNEALLDDGVPTLGSFLKMTEYPTLDVRDQFALLEYVDKFPTTISSHALTPSDRDRPEGGSDEIAPALGGESVAIRGLRLGDQTTIGLWPRNNTETSPCPHT